MRIRNRQYPEWKVEVSDEQTPTKFIGLDDKTYAKDAWEAEPPPGQWEDVTGHVVLEVKDSPAQGRVNVYYNEAGTHDIRIGYLQFKGAYRLAQDADKRLRVERRTDEQSTGSGPSDSD